MVGLVQGLGRTAEMDEMQYGNGGLLPEVPRPKCNRSYRLSPLKLG